MHEVQAIPPSNYTFTVANLGENITVMSKGICVDSKIFFNISNAIIISWPFLHFHLTDSVKSVGFPVLKIGIFINNS